MLINQEYRWKEWDFDTVFLTEINGYLEKTEADLFKKIADTTLTSMESVYKYTEGVIVCDNLINTFLKLTPTQPDGPIPVSNMIAGILMVAKIVKVIQSYTYLCYCFSD